MNATAKAYPRLQGRVSPSYSFSYASQKPQIYLPTPNEESEEEAESKEKVQVKTSSTPLSAKARAALDELAMMFTIQEERCLSSAVETGASASAPDEGPRREDSKLSRASLTSSQLAAEASFIYQHINFEVLSRCIPGFVKTNLNKNTRYLPETFILRVNYWRRRRALGEDSTAKRAAKETTSRPCANDHQHQQQQQAGNGPSKGLTSSKSPRPRTASRQANKDTAASTSSSAMSSPRKSGAMTSDSMITMISA